MRRRAISGREVIYQNNVNSESENLSSMSDSATPWTVASRLLCPGILQAGTLQCNHPLLQGTFQTQGSNQSPTLQAAPRESASAAPRLLSVQPPEVPSAAPPRPHCLHPEASSYQQGKARKMKRDFWFHFKDH